MQCWDEPGPGCGDHTAYRAGKGTTVTGSLATPTPTPKPSLQTLPLALGSFGSGLGLIFGSFSKFQV